MIISRTPFRISFFGGGTDYPAFFRRHGGAVLAATIEKYCYVSVHSLACFFKHRFRASYLRTEAVLDPKKFRHPLIRETLLMLQQREGVEIAYVADLPGRTGIGSSSSFTVGLLHALHALRGQRTTPEELAREAIRVERDLVGDAGGWQDQYEAAYGGVRRIEFGKDLSVKVQTMGIDAERLQELERNLLLFYTGVECSSERILREQNSRADRNEDTLLAMLRMVDCAESILVGNAPLSEFGDLLHESWQLKKSLASGVSNPGIDRIYESALAAGARGGKVLGAGGRGFLCLFCDPGRQSAVRDSLKRLNEVPVRFSHEGSRIIFKTDE